MELRDYQLNAVNAAISAIERRESGIIVAPTASGKSVIMRAVIERIEGIGKRVVVVANEKTVRSQLSARLEGIGYVSIMTPKQAIGHMSGAEEEAIGTAEAMGIEVEAEAIEAEGDGEGVEVILIDEVHHVRRDKAWGRLLHERTRKAWGRLLHERTRVVIGFTATPVWIEELSLPIIYRISYNKLRTDGWMAPPLTGIIATSWEEAQRLSCMGNVVTYISRREDWREEYGRLILAETPLEDRDFRPGETKLCNIATLTTGWDNASVDTVVLARRIGEAQTYLQIIGRLRHGGMVIDLSDNILRFGLDEDALVSMLGKGAGGGKGLPILKRCMGCDRLMSPRQTECPYCGWHAPAPHVSGKLWKRIGEEDLDAAVKALEKACRYTRPCSYTPSGAWPVKMWGSAQTIAYVGSKTSDYWYDVVVRLKKIKARLGERTGETLWRIEGTWWILHASGDGQLMYVCDLSYGSGLVWQRV